MDNENAREQLISKLELIGYSSHGASAALVSNGTIQLLQFALIGLGVAGSIYSVYRIAKNHFKGPKLLWNSVLPFALLILILGAINIYLFMLPMAMRM
ncbi:MAG: hypothetical protein AAGU27_12810 [Dehalobacterium sp.]